VVQALTKLQACSAVPQVLLLEQRGMQLLEGIAHAPGRALEVPEQASADCTSLAVGQQLWPALM